MTALALTAAGRAAVADADHVGTDAIEITHLAVGDGLRPAGADDDGRTALRSERERQAVAGRQAASGHVALVADWTPGASYAVTEIGLVADVDGDTVLLAYWAAEAAAGAAVRAASGTRLLLAVDVAVTSSAADLAVTLSPSVTFAAPPPAATTAVAGISRRATGAEVAAAAAADEEADRAALERAAHVTPYEVARLALAMRGGGPLPAGRTTLKQLAEALAAVEEKLEAGLEQTAVYFGIGALHEAGSNIAGAAVSAVPGGSGISLPAGAYYWEVQSQTNHNLGLYDGASGWRMGNHIVSHALSYHRAVVSAAAARVWSLSGAGPATGANPRAVAPPPVSMGGGQVVITIRRLGAA